MLDAAATKVNIVIPTFASTHPAAQASPASAPQMPQLSFSARPELNRMQRLVPIHCSLVTSLLFVLAKPCHGLPSVVLMLATTIMLSHENFQSVKYRHCHRQEG